MSTLLERIEAMIDKDHQGFGGVRYAQWVSVADLRAAIAADAKLPQNSDDTRCLDLTKTPRGYLRCTLPLGHDSDPLSMHTVNFYREDVSESAVLTTLPSVTEAQATVISTEWGFVVDDLGTTELCATREDAIQDANGLPVVRIVTYRDGSE